MLGVSGLNGFLLTSSANSFTARRPQEGGAVPAEGTLTRAHIQGRSVCLLVPLVRVDATVLAPQCGWPLGECAREQGQGLLTGRTSC